MPSQFMHGLQFLPSAEVNTDRAAITYRPTPQDIIAINQHPYVLEKGLLNDDVANLAKVSSSLPCSYECNLVSIKLGGIGAVRLL